MRQKSFLLIFSLMITIFVRYTVSALFQSVDPIWKTSPFFRADNEKVIRVRTGSDQRPTYTFTFSSALNGVPTIAYGVKGYQGNDYLGQQNWEVQMINVNKTNFYVYVQIYGVTNLNILNVAYIACEPTFPHHLNSFDNVPISYNNTLVNITSKSSQTQTYTNYINYQLQAAGRAFTRFTQPLQFNKILLFMTSIFIQATFRSGNNYYPVQIDVQPTVLNQTHYRLKGTFYHMFQLQKIHFSMIIFNEADVASTNAYYLQYFIWTTPEPGGFITVPQEFRDNFILAMKDWDTKDGKCGIQYIWDFKTQNGQFGVRMERSTPSHYGDCAANQTRSTVFYMKTWNCPDGYKYFNLSSNKCQNGCGDYTFKSIAALACDPCFFGCQDCVGPAAAQCTQCNADHFRYQVSNKTCVCNDGHYDDYINPYCPKCQQITYKCAKCYHVSGLSNAALATQYPCFQCLTGYFYQQSLKKCVDYIACNANSNKFVNITINQCQTCTLTGCKTCDTLYKCKICDQQNKYFADLSNPGICVFCVPPLGCNQCKNLTACVSCKQSIGYFMDPVSQTCKNCSFGCTSCDAATQTCNTCLSSFVLIDGQCYCKNGTYLDQSTTLFTDWSCKRCHYTCLWCSGPTKRDCTNCDITQNRVLNSTNQCQICSLQGCSTCQTFTKCQTCDQANKYYQDVSNPDICKICTPPTGCNECASLTTCVSCDQNKGYYLNSSGQCIDCSAGCQKCDNVDELICTQCDTTAFKLNTVTNKCQCKEGTYLVRSSALCISCNLICLTCTGGSEYQCTRCNSTQQRQLIGKNCKCRSNYREPTATDLIGTTVDPKVCIKIDSKTCQSGFFYVQATGNCQPSCGDGILVGGYQECDDGNLDDGDGCSKSCKIQTNYQCTYSPTRVPQSKCIYTAQIQIQVKTANKKSNSNTLQFQIILNPIIKQLSDINFDSQLSVSGLGGSTVKNSQYNPSTGSLTFQVDYTSLPQNDQEISIAILGSGNLGSNTGSSIGGSGASSGAQLTLGSLKINFGNLQTTNNIKAGVYTESTYQNVNTAQKVSVIAMSMGLGAAGLSLLIKNAVPALQVILTMQACFISLATLTQVSPLTATLYGANSISGYNEGFTPNQSSRRLLIQLQSPNTIENPNIVALGYQSSFYKNANIMLVVQGVLLLLTCFVYLLSIKNVTFKTSYKYIQRTLMMTIIFNTINNVFAMSLMTSAYVLDMALAAAAACMIIGQIAHLCIYYKGYLGMDSSFEIHKVKFKTYFITLMVARISMAVVPAFLKDSPQIAISVNLGIQAVLCIVMTILRPFSHKVMNVIMLIGEYALLVFLANLQVSTSLKQTISNNQSLDLILSWVQIGVFAALGLVALAAAIFGVYSQFCAKDASKAKIHNQQEIQKKNFKQDKFQKQFKQYKKKKQMDVSQGQFKIQDVQNMEYDQVASPTLPRSPTKVVDLDRLLN